MSAPTYLEGVRRAKPGRSRKPNRARWTLLLWGLLTTLFLVVFAAIRSTRPVAAYAPPDAFVEPTVAGAFLADPRLLSTALSVVLFGATALAAWLFMRSQRRAVVPMQEAKLAAAQGDPDRAVDVLRDALRVRRGPGMRSALLHCLAQVAAERGHFTEALEILDEAQAALGPDPSRSTRETSDYHVTVRMTRAEALLGLGRLDEAEAELTPPPAAWMPVAHAYANALSVRLAACRRDTAAVLRLLGEHAVAHERRLTLRERWLLRAIEHHARLGHVPTDALPDDPALRDWIAARLPPPEAAVNALGGAA